MTRLHIDRIAMKLHGVPVDVATAAIDGLDAEMRERLQGRGIDAARLSGLASTLRLPPIHSPLPLDADALRQRLADGLMALLMPPSTLSARDSDATDAPAEETD